MKRYLYSIVYKDNQYCNVGYQLYYYPKVMAEKLIKERKKEEHKHFGHIYTRAKKRKMAIRK